MAGGTIRRITLGNHSTELEGGFNGYYETTNFNAGNQNRFTAKQTYVAAPKSPPPTGKYFKRGWWTDENDKEIKEALIEQRVKFHIQMDKTKVPVGSKIDFTLMDWDGILNPDDPMKLYSSTKDLKTNTYPEINELFTDVNGKASLFITLTDGLIKFTEDDGGNEIELYFNCTYYDKIDKETEKLYLPAEEFNYLIVYEKEVLITVFVELPHSKETGVGALGLAGHSAMAIGERYFDYGPDYGTSTIEEKKYDYDFNNDGDKNDTVYVTSKIEENWMKEQRNVIVDETGSKIGLLGYDFAPGMPWWGTHIAHKKAIRAEDVTLNMVIEHINLHWKGRYDPVSQNFPDATQIYGKIHKIEFYVKESEAKKMTQWWVERYIHLKAYSVYPSTGEQCTTTVKTSIHQAFEPSMLKHNYIPDTTQTPKGLLEDLQAFISTSKQHNGQLATVTVIKDEASDWTN